MHQKTLDEIGLTAGAGGDKASDGHNYLNRYEPIFEPLREIPITLLEIGIENGFSVKIWLEYFPNALIYGVDLLPKPAIEDPRFMFTQGDQTSVDFWQKFINSCPLLDIVIDDGSHKSAGIITTFEAMWPMVRPGGYYIIEDLSTAYMAGYRDGWINQMNYIAGLLHDINSQLTYRPPHWEALSFAPGTHSDRGIDWLQFSEELAIIKKK